MATRRRTLLLIVYSTVPTFAQIPWTHRAHLADDTTTSSTEAQIVNNSTSIVTVTPIVNMNTPPPTPSTPHLPTTEPIPTLPPARASSSNTPLLIGIILGSIVGVLVLVALVLLCRRMRRQRQQQMGPALVPQVRLKPEDAHGKPTHPRRNGEAYASVYATDFTSDMGDSPEWHEGAIVLSPSNRRPDRAQPDLDAPRPFFSYYQQPASMRRASTESCDSSIISYSEDATDKMRLAASSSIETPIGDDCVLSARSLSFTNMPPPWPLGGIVRGSSTSVSAMSDMAQSPSTSYSMTMLGEDTSSQTSSRESYDI
ncbi:unnamed protein product [Aphanomyces euteiches]|uniref:Uncharacterized protein n=1 Tax=Aphanomyces euteiches TaxID=100861 RepID=A0A6G0WSC0_9STRA|nr:hypothetical protein Ae201684_012313 [Aphanomyces euteiches]KAH9096650.1 hypothetical protein Ae201684P_013316 [Aphanomyces euteiches]KAH9135636.1 hypothetical protein AeRB84_019012 [Aphanomyces euteiches]